MANPRFRRGTYRGLTDATAAKSISLSPEGGGREPAPAKAGVGVEVLSRGQKPTPFTPIPAFPLPGGRKEKIRRLPAARGVLRALEALTEQIPGFAGGQSTSISAEGL